MYNLRQFSLIYDMYRNGFLYPTPANLTIHWNFGFLAGIVLFLQIISGILLVFWYIPSVSAAFNSIDYIMRDVNFGWFIRYIHANGASLFFAIIYIHIGRGIYYGSYTYPREIVWVSGMFIFVIMILTAFFGYVLPWGQMSYWAATVISSLLSVIPIFGDILLIYVWGGINIDQPTLTRIFGLHYVLPFILLAFVILHIIFLHEHGSNNPVGINTNDHIFFNSYYTIKDMYSFLILLLAYTFFVFFQPDLLGHSDNYIMADAGVTPSHIVPEWYFLPFYGVLRSIPSKVGGVLLLVLIIVGFIILPFVSRYTIVRSGTFRPFFPFLYWLFVVSWSILGWSGSQPIEEPFYVICQTMVIGVFFFIFVIIPLLGLVEYYYLHYSDLKLS